MPAVPSVETRRRKRPHRARRWLADRKAGLLARWVASASDAQLELAMRRPIRRILLWQIFTTMCQRVDPNAWPTDAVVEFRIRRQRSRTIDRYQVAIAKGRCRATRSPKRTSTVTLDLKPASFLRLVGGAAGAPGLILAGRLRVGGDLLLAARLPRLLKIPRPSGRLR
jgi:SCP-2 sterol transfer family protein